MSVLEDAIDQARTMFVGDTDKHELTVLHDDGLYRHLRFAQPGSNFYWFDLHTAPGLLTVNGDMGTFVFSRERDMFGWFGHKGLTGGIKPDYWAQKLQAPDGTTGVKEWSPEKFTAEIEQFILEQQEDWGTPEAEDFAREVRRTLLGANIPNDDRDAHEAVDNFFWQGTDRTAQFYDSWELDFTMYSTQYLWSCWSVVWGIEQYSKHTANAG